MRACNAALAYGRGKTASGRCLRLPGLAEGNSSPDLKTALIGDEDDVEVILFGPQYNLIVVMDDGVLPRLLGMVGPNAPCGGNEQSQIRLHLEALHQKRARMLQEAPRRFGWALTRLTSVEPQQGAPRAAIRVVS